MTKKTPFAAQRFDLGLNLQSIRNLKIGEIAGGASARFEKNSAIYTGPGFRTACDLGTAMSVPALKEATVFPLMWAKSGTKVFYMTDPNSGTSYDTGVTVTAAEYGWFQEQGNGDMFYINQTDAPFRFAVAQNTVAVTATDTAITVGADWVGKFAASGSVIINGVSYTYSGVSATQLTGFSPLPAISINTVIVQPTNPSTFPSTFNGTFMFDLYGQLFTGGRLHYEHILNWGAPPDNVGTDSTFYNFQANGASQYFGFTEKLTAGIKGIGRAYLFTTNQTFTFTGLDPASGGALIQPVSQNYGAYNPRCVVDMEGTIAFLGKNRLIPISLSLGVGGVSVPQIEPNFDNNLRPWLASLDPDDQQADAKLHYDKTQQLLKIQGRRNGVLETYCFDRGNNSFTPSEVRSAKCFSMFKGASYFGHNNNGKVYQDDYGTTDDGIAIYHAWVTGELEGDKGREYMQAYSCEYTGTMSRGCEHTFNVYVDGSSQPSYSQIFDDSIIYETIGTGLGSNLIPASVAIGGSQDISRVYRFRNEVLLIGVSGESFRLEWVVTKEGVYFKTSDYELNVYPLAQNQRTRN